MSDEVKTEEETEAPDALTKDDIADMIVKTVNAAVSTRLQRNEKKLEETIAASVASALDGRIAPPTESEPPAENDEVKALRAKMKDLESKYEAERNHREQEFKARMVNEERSMLQDALAKQGVPADRMKAAVALLYDSEKRLERDESGDVQFLVPEKGYTDRIPVSEGVEKFLSTAEGKIFLPPRDAAGSGNTGGKAGAGGTKGDDVDALLMNLANMMTGNH